MPNICDFDMRIKGQKKNVLKLCEWLWAEYHYKEDGSCDLFYTTENGDKIPTDHHLGARVFEFCPVYDEEIKKYDDEDEIIVKGFGNCAWSVYSCIFRSEDGMGTYLKTEDHNEDNSLNKAISLDEACKLLELEVEVFSSEEGMCFAEHYLIDNGEITIEEETEYKAVYIGDYETYEEYLRDSGDEDGELLSEDDFDENKGRGIEDVIECEFLCDNMDWNWVLRE